MEREYVKQLVSVLWQYQFTEIPVPFSDETAELIADLSGGSIDAITTICFTIQRHAILRNCPEKMDCEYLRKLLTTRELEKMGRYDPCIQGQKPERTPGLPHFHPGRGGKTANIKRRKRS